MSGAAAITQVGIAIKGSSLNFCFFRRLGNEGESTGKSKKKNQEYGKSLSRKLTGHATRQQHFENIKLFSLLLATTILHTFSFFPFSFSAICQLGETLISIPPTIVQDGGGENLWNKKIRVYFRATVII